MKSKVVWITGASTGIGFELGKVFARGGYTVIATGRRKSRLVSLVSEIRFAGHEAFAFVCDVRKERSVLSTKKKIIENCGTIDVLINNAGITTFKSFADTKTPEFDDIISVNLRGSFLATKAVLPVMLRKKNGNIVNILSVASEKVFTNSSAYSASKAGARAMFNVLREELRKYNIKVTNILPGASDTPMWSSHMRQRYSRRMMTPREVAEVVFQAVNQPKKVVVEEIILRPVKGDI
ncbi:MAG: SDR family oxidoreductase [Ignavibacteria bacterium]|nr:SDR family oxidoreductase [Ignavibacteria bacterium]